ncbi:hypothetical protein [Streptomyces virginiae]|uniref:hypothetical protein n=1 Tax=Streptomyces virginiae TaxID=1961 RepID=UPI0032484F49
MAAAAERIVPVEEGQQVPAAGERIDLVRVNVGVRELAREVDEESGATSCRTVDTITRGRHPCNGVLRASVSRSATHPAVR